MGMRGINNSNSRTISLKRTDGTVVGTARVTGPGGTKKLKKLQYNFRDISNRVLKSKSSLGAKSVVASARAKVAALYRKRATGDYAEDETRHAIAHAESLVRVAKKKARHLEQEEKLKRHEKAERSRELLEKDREEPSAEEIVQQSEEAARISEEELQKLMKELQELMKEMEQAQELQEAAEAIEEGEMDPEDLELLKKKHRASEMKELVEESPGEHFILWQNNRHSVVYCLHGIVCGSSKDYISPDSIIFFAEPSHIQRLLTGQTEKILFLLFVPFVKTCAWYNASVCK